MKRWRALTPTTRHKVKRNIFASIVTFVALAAWLYFAGYQ